MTTKGGINSYWSTLDEIRELSRYPISTLRRIYEYGLPRRSDWAGMDKKKITSFIEQRLGIKKL
jgi:hypothetical protein